MVAFLLLTPRALVLTFIVNVCVCVGGDNYWLEYAEAGCAGFVLASFWLCYSTLGCCSLGEIDFSKIL